MVNFSNFTLTLNIKPLWLFKLFVLRSQSFFLFFFVSGLFQIRWVSGKTPSQGIQGHKVFRTLSDLTDVSCVRLMTRHRDSITACSCCFDLPVFCSTRHGDDGADWRPSAPAGLSDAADKRDAVRQLDHWPGGLGGGRFQQGRASQTGFVVRQTTAVWSTSEAASHTHTHTAGRRWREGGACGGHFSLFSLCSSKPKTTHVHKQIFF